MKKSLIITYGALLILTLSTAFVASSIAISKGIVLLILMISAIKFLLVAFHFMELKKANPFWKVSLLFILFLLIFLIVIFL
jgi:hypothetical protein